MNLSPNSLVFDAGCGPGLVSEALLEAGNRVVGVDLSSEMITRARQRCSRFGDRVQFVQGSIYEQDLGTSFDSVVSRYVLHHVQDPDAFVRRQVELLAPGGQLVLSDHTTDPDPARAAWHQSIERARDQTHTRNLTPGAIVDLLAAAGLERLAAVEEAFQLNFDEWFDRGTPSVSKAETRLLLERGPVARGFSPISTANGSVAIACMRCLVRGFKSETTKLCPD
jgi:SAM-dependent methyltransferase